MQAGIVAATFRFDDPRHDLESSVMAQRPIWRGHLRLALVSCPVALYTARHDRNSTKLNMLNPATGNRIKMVSQDAVTSEPVSRADTVKGYEFAKGQYVVLTADDLDSVKVESSSMMAVEKFVDAGSIDPIYYDSSYYLAPDGKGAEDIYAVLREAIVATGKVALVRVVISQRERTVALRPGEGAGLVAHTLNEEQDLNSSAGLFDSVSSIRVDPEMLKLATQLVDRQSGSYDPADLEDRYETRLRAMIDAKVTGGGLVVDNTPVFNDSNVIDLMAALRKSLGQITPPASEAPPPSSKARSKRGASEGERRQPGLKLPIAGGGKRVTAASEKPEPVAAEPAVRGRKRA